MIIDNFCEHAEGVRQSALESGFGRWAPNKGAIGSSIYDGMNYQAAHGMMLRSLSAAFGGQPIFPNSMFCRITTPVMERAYIHSDREMGEWTCVAYLSHHEDQVSGTGFYRHKRTGLCEMPTLAELEESGLMGELSKDMVKGSELEWEQTDFVRGLFNRAVIFHAPLFHARIPMLGIGDDDPSTARMVHVTHFCL